MLAATMLGASITPVLADDHKGKGKKLGHYKNGKAYGQHPSQNRSRYDDERRRREAEERERQRRYEEERWRASQYNNQYQSRNDLDRLSDQRQKTKNEWRNIAYLSGGVALLGLLQKDNRLVFAGAAGTLYSLYRYEQDRKSQSKIDRLRASYFSQPYFVRDGRRYDRRTVTRNGQRYYQFVRR
ncbi:MAG TPA: hypothetical protein VJ835_06670 [Fimbriimonadaceae bacterium]|nr:hypothetical protein [Fimbriimonadaceae bacterium]